MAYLHRSRHLDYIFVARVRTPHHAKAAKTCATAGFISLDSRLLAHPNSQSEPVLHPIRTKVIWFAEGERYYYAAIEPVQTEPKRLIIQLHLLRSGFGNR